MSVARVYLDSASGEALHPAARDAFTAALYAACADPDAGSTTPDGLVGCPHEQHIGRRDRTCASRRPRSDRRLGRDLPDEEAADGGVPRYVVRRVS